MTWSSAVILDCTALDWNVMLKVALGNGATLPSRTATVSIRYSWPSCKAMVYVSVSPASAMLPMTSLCTFVPSLTKLNSTGPSLSSSEASPNARFTL